MDHNNILAVVLAGGKSKRFGRDKSQVKLGNKILIDYILDEIQNASQAPITPGTGSRISSVLLGNATKAKKSSIYYKVKKFTNIQL